MKWGITDLPMMARADAGTRAEWHQFPASGMIGSEEPTKRARQLSSFEHERHLVEPSLLVEARGHDHQI